MRSAAPTSHSFPLVKKLGEKVVHEQNLYMPTNELPTLKLKLSQNLSELVCATLTPPSEIPAKGVAVRVNSASAEFKSVIV